MKEQKISEKPENKPTHHENTFYTAATQILARPDPLTVQVTPAYKCLNIHYQTSSYEYKSAEKRYVNRKKLNMPCFFCQ